jgi:hypothetical protein
MSTHPSSAAVTIATDQQPSSEERSSKPNSPAPSEKSNPGAAEAADGPSSEDLRAILERAWEASKGIENRYGDCKKRLQETLYGGTFVTGHLSADQADAIVSRAASEEFTEYWKGVALNAIQARGGDRSVKDLTDLQRQTVRTWCQGKQG